MSKEGQRALVSEIRRVINSAAMRNEVIGDEVFGALMHVVSESIAKAREPLRSHLIETVTGCLPAFVRFEAGDPTALATLEARDQTRQ